MEGQSAQRFLHDPTASPVPHAPRNSSANQTQRGIRTLRNLFRIVLDTVASSPDCGLSRFGAAHPASDSAPEYVCEGVLNGPPLISAPASIYHHST